MRSDQPRLDLTSIWDHLPAGAVYDAFIEARRADGTSLGRSEAFGFRKVGEFAGPYPPGIRDYTDAGRAGAEYVMGTLGAWRNAEPPDTAAIQYPALFYAAYIRVLVTYAALDPGSEKSRDALLIASHIAQHAIDTSTPADWKYPNMPLSHRSGEYLQISRTAMLGSAYLDLFAAGGGERFLNAAFRIADTLKERQLPDGRWYFRVDPRTGSVAEDYTSDQAEAVDFFDALIEQHGRADLAAARDKAVGWMLENPVKTHHWQQQWDDVPLVAPFKNLEFYDAALFAVHLAHHATPENHYLETAADLFRWTEDQFVLWEDSFDMNFVTPGVQEQYLCYITIDWHVAHFIRLCQAMHQATGDAIYLKKAVAMADSLTRVQHPKGYFATWMRRLPATQPGQPGPVSFEGLWPNCMSYTAEQLIKFDRYLKGVPSRRP